MNESVFSWSWQFHTFLLEPTPGGNILLHPLSQVSLPGPTLLVHDPGVTGEFGKFKMMWPVLFACFRPLGVEFKSSLTIVAATILVRCKRLVFHHCFQDASYDIICQLQVNHSKKFATTLRAELCRRPHTHELLWSCNEPLRRVRIMLNSKSFSYGRDGHEPNTGGLYYIYRVLRVPDLKLGWPWPSTVFQEFDGPWQKLFSHSNQLRDSNFWRLAGTALTGTSTSRDGVKCLDGQ